MICCCGLDSRRGFVTMISALVTVAFCMAVTELICSWMEAYHDR